MGQNKVSASFKTHDGKLNLTCQEKFAKYLAKWLAEKLVNCFAIFCLAECACVHVISAFQSYLKWLKLWPSTMGN